MSRTSSHLRNALVSVSCTYVTMHIDDDDEAIYALPPRGTNTKVHSSNAPGAYGSTTSYPTNLSINSRPSSCFSRHGSSSWSDSNIHFSCWSSSYEWRNHCHGCDASLSEQERRHQIDGSSGLTYIHTHEFPIKVKILKFYGSQKATRHVTYAEG